MYEGSVKSEKLLGTLCKVKLKRAILKGQRTVKNRKPKNFDTAEMLIKQTMKPVGTVSWRLKTLVDWQF